MVLDKAEEEEAVAEEDLKPAAKSTSKPDIAEEVTDQLGQMTIGTSVSKERPIPWH